MQIFFPDMAEMECVVKLGLWCFNNNRLGLQRWLRVGDFSYDSFKNVPFWIHMKWPPNGMLNERSWKEDRRTFWYVLGNPN